MANKTGGIQQLATWLFDGDQDVDGFDFLLWQRGFGTPAAAKVDVDANDDLSVDSQDLAIWSGSYSSKGTVSGIGTVERENHLADQQSLLPLQALFLS